ncbi:MAG TPA: hypothetical protein EYP17_01360 [Candidatus Latescibacteria bacterium]|nr:hypothetical protein [Candidatus Latescibacterota bacterium]
MRITSYSFGRVIVDGNSYTDDLIILPDRVRPNWWREEGHELRPSDLEEVLEARPEVLIVGTGYYGRMQVTREAEECLRKAGIVLEAVGTQEACERFNKLAEEGRKVAAALHLTC